jgi:transketolase
MKHEMDLRIANTVRSLVMDMVEEANSGHPGLPLGMADMVTLLFTESMKYDPSAPDWRNRDRFVLSAGHGSALLYALLHLTGYKLSLEELKNFRQIGSLTPGHPEYGHTTGVDATTGPLGAGFAMAVGMAMSEAQMATRFNRPDYAVVDHKTYVLMGDGCIMEGVSSEAASLAGHLKLGKLVAIYDSNSVTIEGATSLAFSESVADRFMAYGWQVLCVSAHDFVAMRECLNRPVRDGDRPTLIIAKSVIGKGAPNKAGSAAVHGSPLGKEEVVAAKKAMGLDPTQTFTVDEEVRVWLHERVKQLMTIHKAEQDNFNRWRLMFPDLAKEWDTVHQPLNSIKEWFPHLNCTVGQEMATRVASGKIINLLATRLPMLVGGSADLAPSNNTHIDGGGSFSEQNRLGRNLHFGVREHAMGNVANGMLLHGPLRVFCATFLVFSDYMRMTLRLAAMMKLPTIFIFTHDSVHVGEDGPTHQPIEHLESLRLIPDLTVLRPADAQECQWAWSQALLSTNKPTVLALTRQNLRVFAKPDGWMEMADKGGYIAFQNAVPFLEVVIFACGSEVNLAIEAAQVSKRGVRVISVTNRTVLLSDDAYINELAPLECERISVEAGVRGGWATLAYRHYLSLEHFGLSGKEADVVKALEFNVEKLVTIIATC